MQSPAVKRASPKADLKNLDFGLWVFVIVNCFDTLDDDIGCCIAKPNSDAYVLGAVYATLPQSERGAAPRRLCFEEDSVLGVQDNLNSMK